MAEKHLKKCSTSLVIGEMQIKATLRFYLTSVRMTKINKTSNSSCWQGRGVRGTLIHCWWECKLAQWNSEQRFLRNMGISLPHDPDKPLLGTCSKDTSSFYSNICSAVVIAALFIIVRNRKQLKCLSTGDWKKKLWSIHTTVYLHTIITQL